MPPLEARRAVGLHTCVVDAARACQRTEDGQHEGVGREPELAARFGARRLEVGALHRPAHDLIARRLATRQGIRQEDAVGERGGKTVCQAEVRVGLGQHARDPQRARSEQHGAGDVPPAPEHGVRPAPAQDACAGGRGRYVVGESRRQAQGRPPRQSLDAKGIEGVAGCSDQSLFGAIGRAREGDLGARAHELLGHGQRGHHVAGGAACRDQNPRAHIARRRRARAAPACAGRTAVCVRSGRLAARLRGAALTGTRNACPP